MVCPDCINKDIIERHEREKKDVKERKERMAWLAEADRKTKLQESMMSQKIPSDPISANRLCSQQDHLNSSL